MHAKRASAGAWAATGARRNFTLAASRTLDSWALCSASEVPPHHSPSYPYIRPTSPSRFPMSNRWVKYLEPAIKVILPPIAVSIELYFDHPDGFQ